MTAFAASQVGPRSSDPLSGASDRYRVLYDGAPVLMQAVDRDGRLAQVNGHWLKVLGYDHSEVIGRRPSTFMTEASRSYALEVPEGELDQPGSSNDVEYQLVKKTGEVIDVLLSAVALPEVNGEAGSVLVFMVDVSERRRAEASLRELAVTEERDRLAGELHDTLTQSLSSISLQLGVASDLMQVDPPEALAQLESARALTSEVLEEARRSIWDLQPLALESLSLTQAVYKEAAHHSSTGARVSVEIAGEAPRAFDRHNEQTALRVVQEALGNIGRHAHAENALVRLSFGSSHLHIEVSDDGDGFPPSTSRRNPRPDGGFGLIAMRERVRLTGGTIEVRSTPRQGTEIRIQIPYETTPAVDGPVDALEAARTGRRPAADSSIHSVHEGGSLLQPVIGARLMNRLDIGEYPHLTQREREVLLLLVHGARNKQMAQDLGVSVNTIKFHIDNVFKKLGTGTRTEAVRVARERGLLGD